MAARPAAAERAKTCCAFESRFGFSSQLSDGPAGTAARLERLWNRVSRNSSKFAVALNLPLDPLGRTASLTDGGARR